LSWGAEPILQMWRPGPQRFKKYGGLNGKWGKK
jgi:hypothetical protein